jgi:hypothetical protein
MHQHYANELLQCIFRSNTASRINILALSPHQRITWNLWRDEDTNGHMFPDYHYVKRTVNDPLRGERVIALSVRNCREEMTHATALEV